MTAWCLRDPSGKLVPGTLNENKQDAQISAFDHLYAEFPGGWPKDYWQRWDPFIKARKRRGWHVVQVTVTEDQSSGLVRTA